MRVSVFFIFPPSDHLGIPAHLPEGPDAVDKNEYSEGTYDPVYQESIFNPYIVHKETAEDIAQVVSYVVI